MSDTHPAPPDDGAPSAELHAALADAELTTLRLLHDWRTGRFDLTLSRAFDLDLDFAGYARRFQVDQTPCADPKAQGGAKARALITMLGAEGALRRLEALLRGGRHEMVVLHVNARLGMRTAHAVHSSVLGANNGHHALRAGGVRRHEPREPEHDVLVDALNLGRAMSFKNAAADLPMGGCKMTVQCAPFALDDADRLGFLAWAIDRGHFFTGPDMGFSPALADALRARFTRNIVGGVRGPLGPTGTPTAQGCSLALREAARQVWGQDDLRGRSVVVQGLGAVGGPLAALVAGAGARLIVADVDPARVEQTRASLGPSVVVVRPEDALATEADIVCPSAIGGVLDAAAIDRLRCRLVLGPANNQLRATSKDQELVLALRLQSRGILFVPDWAHNIAGVVAGYEEYVHGADARLERLQPRLERVCRDGIRALLEEATATRRTPADLAYARVEGRIYPA